MVDYYFPSGKKYREVFYIMKRVKNDKCIGIYVKTRTGTVLKTLNVPVTPESLQELNHAVELEKRRVRSLNAVVDDFMDWRIWKPGKKFYPGDTMRYPFRYFWNVYERRWIFYKEYYRLRKY